MNFKILSIALVLAVSGAISGYFYGSKVTDTKWEAKTRQAINEAVSRARADEKAKQEKTNEILQVQADSYRDTADILRRDLDRMRNRKSSRHLSADTKAQCQGTTGAELSREYAEAFAREAARADRLRAALRACYDYADSLQD